MEHAKEIPRLGGSKPHVVFSYDSTAMYQFL